MEFWVLIIPIATQIELSEADLTGIEDDKDKLTITLGNETAFFLSIGITAHFDSALLYTPSQTKHRKR